MIGSLWHDLSRMIWSWYSHDRIRASPSEGRLLRIMPGDLITLGEIDATIIDRSSHQSEDGICIRLMCHTINGHGELHVNVTDLESPQVIWIEAGRRDQVEAADVQVWPRKSR